MTKKATVIQKGDNELIANKAKVCWLLRFIGINFYLELIKFIPLTKYSDFLRFFIF